MAPTEALRTRATRSRHVWSGRTLTVEDLSSANGTFVDGERIKVARTRPGVDLRCGQIAVPRSHEGLHKLLKAGVRACDP